MSSISSLGTRSLRVRKNVAYNEQESTPPKKKKTEPINEKELQELYKKLSSAAGKCTNLETIYESPKKVKDSSKSLMAIVKQKRRCTMGEFFNPNKTKKKARKDKAKKFAKLSGVKVPNGNVFSVDDVATALSKISDSEDDYIHNQTLLKTPVCSTTPKSKIIFPTPESTNFRCGDMIVADDTHPEIQPNWSEVMSPEDLFNHSMSVLDSNIFDEDEEVSVKPKKRKDRRSGGFRDHLKGILSFKKEDNAACSSSSSSFLEKLKVVSEEPSCTVANDLEHPKAKMSSKQNSEEQSSDIKQFNSCPFKSSIALKRTKTATMKQTSSSLVPGNTSPQTVLSKRRRVSGVQKSLYVSLLDQSPSADEVSNCSSVENSQLSTPTTEEKLSNSFTDEDGNLLSEQEANEGPEIVLKYKCKPENNNESSLVIPLTNKLELMNVRDGCYKVNSSNETSKLKQIKAIPIAPEVHESGRDSPTDMMLQLSLDIDDQHSTTRPKKIRRRSSRLMPYMLTDSVSTNDDQPTCTNDAQKNSLGRLWVDKTPPTILPKRTRRRSLMFNQSIGINEVLAEETKDDLMSGNNYSIFVKDVSFSEKCTDNATKQNKEITTNEHSVGEVKRINTSKINNKGKISDKNETKTNSDGEFKMANKNKTTKRKIIKANRRRSIKKAAKLTDSTTDNYQQCVLKSDPLKEVHTSELGNVLEDFTSSKSIVKSGEKSNSLDKEIINVDLNEDSGSLKLAIASSSDLPLSHLVSVQSQTPSPKIAPSSPNLAASSLKYSLSPKHSPSSPKYPPSSPLATSPRSIMPKPPSESEVKKTLQTLTKYQARYGQFYHPSQGIDKYDDGSHRKKQSKPGDSSGSPKEKNSSSSRSYPSVHPALASCNSSDILIARKSFLKNYQKVGMSDSSHFIESSDLSSASNSPGGSPIAGRSFSGSPTAGRKNKIMLTSLSETEAVFDAPSPKMERKDFFQVKD